jgi:CRISPR/Cas system CMR-associated protein Cmr3 (group 5 of RAMP superfamily)
MSRPKPNVLLEHTEKSTYKTEQVLFSDGVWAVFYDEKPINLKTSNLLVQYPGPKYKKVSFSNPGHAKNLAKKLNTQFKTDKFTVVLLKVGEQVYP